MRFNLLSSFQNSDTLETIRSVRHKLKPRNSQNDPNGSTRTPSPFFMPYIPHNPNPRCEGPPWVFTTHFLGVLRGQSILFGLFWGDSYVLNQGNGPLLTRGGPVGGKRLTSLQPAPASPGGWCGLRLKKAPGSYN